MDIFCKIINGEIPSYTIYEDNLVKVFLDVNPSHNGHCLIVPKTHYENFFDIDENTINHITKVAKIMSERITNKLNCDGITFTQNNGYGQDVKHYHLHLIPKYKEEEKLTIDEVYNKLKD